MAFRLLRSRQLLSFFLVLAAVMPHMGEAVEVALTVAPIYIAYADCSAQRMAEMGHESPVTVAIIFPLERCDKRCHDLHRSATCSHVDFRFRDTVGCRVDRSPKWSALPVGRTKGATHTRNTGIVRDFGTFDSSDCFAKSIVRTSVHYATGSIAYRPQLHEPLSQCNVRWARTRIPGVDRLNHHHEEVSYAA